MQVQAVYMEIQKIKFLKKPISQISPYKYMLQQKFPMNFPEETPTRVDWPIMKHRIAGGKGAGARVGTTADGGPLGGVGCGASQGRVHHRRPTEGSRTLAAAVAATADTVPKGRGTATAQLLALGGHLLQGTAGGLTGGG